MGVREGWPYLPMHEDMRMTLIAWATAGRAGFDKIGFLPCRLTPNGAIEPLKLGTEGADQVLKYFEECNVTQKLNAKTVASQSVKLAGYDTVEVISATP